MYDGNTNSVIARYEIQRILFYARGVIESDEASCFAFTWSHGDTQESAIFQCHVFRCDIAEAVTRVSSKLVNILFMPHINAHFLRLFCKSVSTCTKVDE